MHELGICDAILKTVDGIVKDDVPVSVLRKVILPESRDPLDERIDLGGEVFIISMIELHGKVSNAVSRVALLSPEHPAALYVPAVNPVMVVLLYGFRLPGGLDPYGAYTDREEYSIRDSGHFL